MFKKKDKEAERVRKEQKRIIKEAREEEKARERKAKEEAKQRKLKERNKALAKKEGWYEERRPDYNPSRMLEEAADIWSAARLGDLERMKQYISQGIGIGARDKVRPSSLPSSIVQSLTERPPCHNILGWFNCITFCCGERAH